MCLYIIYLIKAVHCENCLKLLDLKLKHVLKFRYELKFNKNFVKFSQIFAEFKLISEF